jgi:hypothetical protein
VGLVGTFAGLMETLRGVAPLLADEQMTTLRALAAPLAGLDVTFGASLVGILVTLSLALVQGDLALAEEATLARLEERTRHLLLPTLFPASEDTDERTLREMTALRAELGEFLVRTSAAAAEKVAAVAKTEVDRLVSEVRSAVAESVQTTAGRVETGLLSLGNQIEGRLAPIFAAQERQLTALQQSAERAAQEAVAAGADAAQQISTATERTLTGLDGSLTELRQTQQALLRDTATVVVDLKREAQQAAETLQAALLQLGETQAAASTQLLTTHAAQCQRLDRSLHDLAATQAARSSELLAAHTAQVQKLDARLVELGAGHAAATSQLLEVHAAQVAKLDQSLLAMAETHTQHSAELLSAGATQTQALGQTLRALGETQASASERLLSAQVAAEERRAQSSLALQQALTQTLAELTERHLAHSERLHREQSEGSTRREQALVELYAQQAAQLEKTTATLCQRISDTVGGEGLKLSQAAQALQQTAEELRAATASMAGPLSALSPELAALSREVALLAAEHESEEPSATLAEILRLGEGIERLEALLQLGSTVAEHSEPALRPAPKPTPGNPAQSEQPAKPERAA